VPLKRTSVQLDYDSLAEPIPQQLRLEAQSLERGARLGIEHPRIQDDRRDARAPCLTSYVRNQGTGDPLPACLRKDAELIDLAGTLGDGEGIRRALSRDHERVGHGLAGDGDEPRLNAGFHQAGAKPVGDVGEHGRTKVRRVVAHVDVLHVRVERSKGVGIIRCRATNLHRWK